MKKKLTFGTFETKKDAFIAYQKGLDSTGRMKYLQQLRIAAFGKRLNPENANPKKIVSFSMMENEDLKAFYKRVFK